jgi:glycerate 2-kinase
MHGDRFMTATLKDQRVMRILEAALDAVEPGNLVRRFLATTQLPPHSRCFLLGLGKAAEGMTRRAAESLGTYEAALVITKSIRGAPPARFSMLEAGHPIPDQRSIAAGRAALEFVSGLGPEDLLVCLISGGGSALASAPVEGVSLRELQAITSSALESGIGIDEVNNLRQCLDRLKGGGLAAATKARVLGIILSDVIGDRIDAIASGPTVPVQADPVRALRLLQRLPGGLSDAVKQHLLSFGTRRADDAGDRIRNTIIGNARLAADGACHQAQREGFLAEVMDAAFEGEAHLAGREFGARLAMARRSSKRPTCVIAIGETTVTLPSNHGLGGRNQELALAAVEPLDSVGECLLIALATDGEDGPSEAAGAVVNGSTAARARTLGMLAADYLARHDSSRYFETLGDLLKPGSTGTNVNDIVLLFSL